MVSGRAGHSSALAPLVKANAATATSVLTIFPMVPPNFLMLLHQVNEIASAHFKGASLQKATASFE